MVTRITKWTMTGVAFLVIIGFFGIVGMLFFFPVNPGIRDIMMLLVGALSASLNNIVKYYFGNSLPKPKTNN